MMAIITTTIACSLLAIAAGDILTGIIAMSIIGPAMQCIFKSTGLEL